jgi:hypothetical protein
MPSVLRHGSLPLVVVPGNLGPGASGHLIIGDTDKLSVAVERVRHSSYPAPICLPMSASLGTEPLPRYRQRVPGQSRCSSPCSRDWYAKSPRSSFLEHEHSAISRRLREAS